MSNNVVIEVLDEEHGKKVLDYFEKQGWYVKNHYDVATKKGNYSSRYYGIINGHFNNYPLQIVNSSDAKIITLPEEKTYPKLMEVSLSSDFSESAIRVVFMEKNGKYLAWIKASTIKESESKTETIAWTYARDIQEKVEEIVELTIEDISNGKSVGVKPELIRIKK